MADKPDNVEEIEINPLNNGDKIGEEKSVQF